MLSTGEASSYDFAYVDAAKTEYDAYYELCLQLVRPGVSTHCALLQVVLYYTSVQCTEYGFITCRIYMHDTESTIYVLCCIV